MANVSAVATPDDAQHDQHRDEAEVARRRPCPAAAQRVADGGRPARAARLHPALLVDGRARPCSPSVVRVASAASRLTRCAVPSITRSSTRPSSSSARGRLAHDPALAHDQHPVGQAEHLGHLAGHQQHADAAVGQPADQRVDLAARTDVDAAGRLVEQQHVEQLLQQPAARARPSAGCRRRACAPAGSGSARAHVELRGHLGGRRQLARRRRGTRPGEPAAARAGTTLRYTGSPSSRPWLLRSSGARPMPARTAAGTDPRRSARPSHARRCPRSRGGRRRPSRGSPSGRTRPARPGRRSRRPAP